MRRTDRQLLDRLNALRVREHTTCVDILLVLVQVERRKLHEELGHSSLFAFATQHLRYSESAAGRRVQAARCVRDHPEVIPLLRRGAVNLSTISLVNRVLTRTNKAAVLAQIAGKSQREVAQIVARYEPPRPVRDRIQPMNVRRAAQAVAMGQFGGTLGFEAPAVRDRPSAQAVDLQRKGTGPSAPTTSEPIAPTTAPGNHSRSGSDSDEQHHLDRRSGTTSDNLHRATTQSGTHFAGAPISDFRGTSSTSSASETCFKVQFAAGPEFVRKFEEARALLSGHFPRGASIESVLEAGLDAFLDRRSPTRRQARRKAREEKRAAHGARQTGVPADEPLAGRSAGRVADRPAGRGADRPAGRGADRPAGEPLPLRESTAVQPAGRSGWGRTKSPRTSRRRTVSAAVRDAVFERDGGCCSFVGSDGRRCRSTHDLEIDHRQPVARGGPDSMDNLRVLCAVHNRLEAERVFGVPWMQRFARS